MAPGRTAYMGEVGADHWVGTELSDDEVESLWRAVQAGLVALSADEQGLRLAGFPPADKQWRLYGHWEQNAYWSWQEMFVQLAFASELVLDHHWPPVQVKLEVGLDIAVTDANNYVLLAEAKRSVDELAYVFSVMTEMSADPLAHRSPKPKSKEENAARKYIALQHYQPSVYVEVAPNVRRAWNLDYCSGPADGPQVMFEPRADIPVPIR